MTPSCNATVSDDSPIMSGPLVSARTNVIPLTSGTCGLTLTRWGCEEVTLISCLSSDVRDRFRTSRIRSAFCASYIDAVIVLLSNQPESRAA